MQDCYNRLEGDEEQRCWTMPAANFKNDNIRTRRTSSLSNKFSTSLVNLSSAPSPPSLWGKIKANFTSLVTNDPPKFYRTSSLNSSIQWNDSAAHNDGNLSNKKKGATSKAKKVNINYEKMLYSAS